MVESARTTEIPAFTASLASLYRDLLDFSRIGNRWVGTDGEVRGRELVVERLQAAGLDVRLESYPYLHYAPRAAALEVLAPLAETLPSEPVSYSANAAVVGEALFAGQGRPADFEEIPRLGTSLQGKIAVVRAKGGEKFYRAHDYGAIGLVVISDAPEGLIRSTTLGPYPPSLTPPFDGQVVPIPAVATSQPAGDRLLRLMTLGPVRLRLEQQGDYAERISANVVARIPGTERPAEVVMIGAHHDTKYEVGGAVDNSTGLAALCELARFFSRQRPRRSVDLLSFGGEEIGLIGSAAYARAHADEIRRQGLAMVNLDSMTSALLPHRSVYASADWLRDLGVAIADQVGWPVDSIFELNTGYRADAVPFIELGVPAIWLSELTPDFGNPYYHSRRDLIETIDPHKFRRVVQVAGSVASHLANVEVPKPG